MRKIALIIILAFGLGGCATLSQPGGPFYGVEQKKMLSDAVILLQQGKKARAAELLAAVCKAPPVPGVTDEALFRLGVLRLGPGDESKTITQSRNYLNRLVKEFPDSSWTPPALTLSGFLAGTDNKLQQLQQDGKLKEVIISLTKENRELKERNASLLKEQRVLKDSNLSLLKENTELRQNVEKLKYIDLDLERRPRNK
ncbi:MAG TPA: hypothetical protein VFG19_12345 [Geobacteraceae bacterium]|nr:hypothetical protein [Geobacteraceae bacterium]